MLHPEEKQKLIAVIGPTASGKSSCAHSLAQTFGGFLVAADSRQVYREMNIFTGKDIGEWTDYKGEPTYMVDGIPEYLVDYVSPNQAFTLYDYQKDANNMIQKCADKNVPILVGGTGMYISAVIDNYDLSSVPDNSEVRDGLYQRLEKEGIEVLYAELCDVDPGALEYIDKANERRIIRALEVYELTGKPFTESLGQHESLYEPLIIGMDIERDVLYDQINTRVDEMVENGGFDEAYTLYTKYNPELPAMSSIGYKQCIMYFKDEITKQEAIRLIKRDMRHYAKRQLTWFKRDPRIQWVKSCEEAHALTHEFLAK